MSATVHHCNPECGLSSVVGLGEYGVMRARRLGRRTGRGIGLSLVLGGLLLSGSARGADNDSEAAKRVSTQAAMIDQRLKEAWEQASLKPSPACTEEEFLRRAYLDLI